MANSGISQYIINIIELLYVSSNNAIIINNMFGYCFHTTVGVRQGCRLSPVLLNTCLEQIMQDTLQNDKSTISVGGREISNLRFFDDIDRITGSNDELQ